MSHASEHYLYPLWVRLWHVANGVLFLVLLVTGTAMHFGEAAGTALDFRLSRLLHNGAGILITVFYLWYFLGLFFSANRKHYRLTLDDFKAGIAKQVRYYCYGIFAGEPHPFPHTAERKFNPLQKLSYLGVMVVLFPMLTLTGWMLFFPDQLPERVNGWTGINVTSMTHAAVGYVMTLFMVVHVYLGTTGSTPVSLFRGIITGYTEPRRRMLRGTK